MYKNRIIFSPASCISIRRKYSWNCEPCLTMVKDLIVSKGQSRRSYLGRISSGEKHDTFCPLSNIIARCVDQRTFQSGEEMGHAFGKLHTPSRRVSLFAHADCGDDHLRWFSDRLIFASDALNEEGEKLLPGLLMSRSQIVLPRVKTCVKNRQE
jgi:hypothetical protein